MDNNLYINEETIIKIFRSFHIITKYRIVLYDAKFKEIVSYPNNDCKFCTIMHSITELNNKCINNNNDAFIAANNNKGLYLYRCHAGLIEATYPLKNEKEIILGYLMIGQVSDDKDNKITRDRLKNYLDEYQIFLPNYDNLLSTPNKSIEEIEAAADILELCTLYLNLQKTIEYNKNTFIENFNEYINNHLKDNLSVDVLMDAFGLSKNALYNSFNEYSNLGIAEYIKKIRLEKAKYLLVHTKYSVKKISIDVGFMDYNYFCRTFKKYYGISAKKYRLLEKEI